MKGEIKMKKLLSLVTMLTISTSSMTTLVAMTPNEIRNDFTKYNHLQQNNNINTNGIYIKKIKLWGLGQTGLSGDTEYKGEIGIDLVNKKIIFLGNNIPVHVYYDGKKLDSKRKLYKMVTIKNDKNKIIKQIAINGTDSMQSIIKKYKLQNGITYKENYSITVWSAEPNRTGMWQSGLARQKANSTTTKLEKSELDDFIPVLKKNNIESSEANQNLEELNQKISNLEKEKNNLVKEKEEIKNKLNLTAQEKTALEEKIASDTAENGKLKAELEQIKGNNETLVREHEAKIKALDLKIVDLTSKLDKTADEKIGLEKKAGLLEKKVAELENEKAALEEDKKNIENKLNEITKTKTALEEKIASETAENGKLKAELGQIKGNNETLVKEHEAKIQALDLKIAGLASKLDKSTDEKAALENEIRTKTDESNNLKAELEQTKKNNEVLVTEQETKIKALDLKIVDLKDKLDNSQDADEKATLENEIRAKTDESNTLKAELEETKKNNEVLVTEQEGGVRRNEKE